MTLFKHTKDWIQNRSAKLLNSSLINAQFWEIFTITFYLSFFFIWVVLFSVSHCVGLAIKRNWVNGSFYFALLQRWKKKRRLENIRWISKHLSDSSIGWKTCIWTTRQTNRTFWTKLPSRKEMMVRESTTCSTLVLQWPPSWRISPYAFFMLAARDFVVL